MRRECEARSLRLLDGGTKRMTLVGGGWQGLGVGQEYKTERMVMEMWMMSVDARSPSPYGCASGVGEAHHVPAERQDARSGEANRFKSFISCARFL